MSLFRTSLLAALFAAPAFAAPVVTLDQAMAHPDWIGTPVESAWWSWDSKSAYYWQKRAGTPLFDTWRSVGGKSVKVEDRELAQIDSAQLVYNRERTRALMLRNGDLFERDLKTGALLQITRSATPAAAPQYAANGKDVQFRQGGDWFQWDRTEHLVHPLAQLLALKDPAAAKDADAQRDMQLRLIQTLKRQKDDREAIRLRGEQQRLADTTRAPRAIYLGDAINIDGSSLSPDAKWLLVVVSNKGGDKGRVGKMPRYVTESGYEEFDDQRTRVGRNYPGGQSLKLVDLTTRTVRDVPLDALPGIATDPLAAMRAAQKLDALKGNRPVRMGDASDSVVWSANGAKVAVMARAIDNKDRWIATVDLTNATLKPAHRLTDRAWVNFNFTDFGWLPDNSTLWFQSEESGYVHLYALDAAGKQRALTQGQWEATNVEWSSDGGHAWMLCNRKAPISYEVCELDARSGVVKEVTSLEGVESFSVSPDERKLLLRHSAAYMPPQVAMVPAHGGAVQTLTDTRSEDFKSRQWIQPEYVAVPSTHGAAPIWGKLYRPAIQTPGKKYPVVMFVHGAGYLQNASKRYPNYFREQMFHNLLVEKGYIVLDLDYRASSGYGRDWRTAIYRQMGHPELEDYIDGVKWLTAKYQADPDHVGLYGGSYGGFMTMMALMRAPELFKSGAALRPVTDWTTYNHEYTANILNTPELDPEAYKVSSPIEYAENLKGSLLIAHGMVDDNVFFQDSVRLSQRLIELKKDNWELAAYPLERHGFVQPESWFDEYRRIEKLFDRTLK